MIIYVNPKGQTPIGKLALYEDAIETLTVDWEAWCALQGTALSSAAWVLESGNAVIGANTQTNNTSKAAISAPEEGYSLIRVKGTMADGQIHAITARVIVKDPTEYLANDYGWQRY